MEGGGTMGEGRGGMAEDIPVIPRKWWGLRPWKRHSTILLVGGSLYILVGFQYAITKTTPGREVALAVVLQVAPINFWGSLFVIAGLLTIISSKWPPMTETWGYSVLTGFSSGWAATYLTGIIFYHSPKANLTQVFLWGVLGFMWWAVSGLPNPERPAVENGRR
jgi:hypothetical protein